MEDEFQFGINSASKTIECYTYPILNVGRNSLPEIIASCIFLEVKGQFFLVTAAHAIIGNESGLLTRGDGHLFDIVGNAHISRSSDKDHFDIGTILINSRIIREKKIKVIPKSMYTMSVEVTNPHSRAVSGFLSSMNKQFKVLDRKDKVLTGKCFTFFGDAEFDGEYEKFGKAIETHIGIEFKAGTDNTGKHLSNPPWPPRGISGGGSWLVPDLSRPELVFLEGIFIEGYKSAKKMYAFSTRLERVLGFIRQTHYDAFNRLK